MRKTITTALALLVASFTIAAGAVMMSPTTADAAVTCTGKITWKVGNCLWISEICEDSDAQISYHRISMWCTGTII